MIQPHRLEDCAKLQLNNPEKWTLQGHSKAGERTGFWLDPLHIVLDAGLATFRTPKAILLTHRHTDHSMGVPDIFTAHAKDSRPLYIAEDVYEPMTQLFRAICSLSRAKGWGATASNEELWLRQKTDPMIVKPNDKFIIPKINNVEVEVLEAHHDADSIGYGFSIVKNKLKQEYLKLLESVEGKKELGHLRKSKVQITEEIKEPQMCFYCDSTIDNLTKHDEWKTYPVIIVECTGFPKKHTVELMNHRHHTHLDDLEKVMMEHKEKQWILIHPSQAMNDEQLQEHEDRLRANELNVTIWRDSL